MSGRSGRRNGLQTPALASSGRGSGRAAKTQARAKMDAQAKELAEFQRQVATKYRGRAPATLPVPKGTRISKRLRGAAEEEEWQPMPDEWLEDSGLPAPTEAPKPPPKTGLESDDESALTSLSDEEQEQEPVIAAEDNDDRESPYNDEEDSSVDGVNGDAKSVSEVANDFVEWETVSLFQH